MHGLPAAGQLGRRHPRFRARRVRHTSAAPGTIFALALPPPTMASSSSS